uniref:Uncharacterized protein n=1 Tax=Oryza punctata TaxID=4537 RepID=A0A0E0K269_ORYPU
MPRNGDDAAKKRPWYRRALGGLIPSARHAAIAAPPPPAPAGTVERRTRWWWASSLKTTSAAFAREVCICAPLCSYDGIMGVQVDAVAPTMMTRSSAGISPSPPRRASPGRAPAAALAPAGQGARTAGAGGGRRSAASPRRASPRASRAPPAPVAVATAAAAVEGPRKRVSFSGGESLWNDELVRRFVRAQEGMPRRGEIDIANRHRRRRWRAPGKSRLRWMSLAHVADDDEAGETNALA